MYITVRVQHYVYITGARVLTSCTLCTMNDTVCVFTLFTLLTFRNVLHYMHTAIHTTTCKSQVLECKKGALKAHQQLHATLGEKASCEAQFQHSKQELKTEDDRLAGKCTYLN
jgi:hypothetical protein